MPAGDVDARRGRWRPRPRPRSPPRRRGPCGSRSGRAPGRRRAGRGCSCAPAPAVDRQAGRHPKPGRRRLGDERPAEHRDPLAHADEAAALVRGLDALGADTPGRARRRSRSRARPGRSGMDDVRAPAPRVLERVRQRFLDDAVGRDLEARVERPPLARRPTSSTASPADRTCSSRSSSRSRPGIGSAVCASPRIPSIRRMSVSASRPVVAIASSADPSLVRALVDGAQARRPPGSRSRSRGA